MTNIITNEPRFSPQEMVACIKCGKLNPPNRLTCFYCVADLPIDIKPDSELNLNLRRLESWESGINVLAKSDGTPADPEGMARLARTVGLDAEVLDSIIGTGILLPICRIESEQEAELVADIADATGLLTVIMPDIELRPAENPVRLWHIDLKPESLVLTTFNERKRTEIRYDDLKLIVCGQINETRTESENKLKKGKSEIIEEAATFSDKLVVDLFTSIEPKGFRISTAGFDFSTLAEQKTMISANNLELLIETIAEKSSFVRVDRKYQSVRRLMDNVWERESTDQTYGLRITGIGKRKVDRVATSTNELQFLKYSRSRII